MAASLIPEADDIDPLRNLDLQKLQAVAPEMQICTSIATRFPFYTRVPWPNGGAHSVGLLCASN